MVSPSLPTGSDVLAEPDRVTAARRLLAEAAPRTHDRLAELAARLAGAPMALVCLVTDEEVPVGSHGLPTSVGAGPLLLGGSPCAVTVRLGTPVVSRRAAEDQRLAGLPAAADGSLVAYLGVPLRTSTGDVVGVLATFDRTPRDWSADAVAALEQLAASVVAELELAAARSAVSASLMRLELALEASAVGIWERDLRTGVVHWDDRCAAIFGLEGAVDLHSVPDLLDRRIHPDDHAAVSEAMRAALAGSGEYVVEARVLRVDGTVRWTVSRGRVLRDAGGAPVRVIGTTVDVTGAREDAQRRLSAVQRAAAMAAVAAEMAGASRIDQLADITLRGAQVLGAESGGIAVLDPDGGALRLHLGRRLSDAVREEHYVDVPPEGVEIALDDSLPTQYVARHGERVLLAGAEEGAVRFPRMAEIAELYDIRALAALPLRVEGRLVGSFVATWTGDHEFADSDVQLLEGLAAQIALTVSRLQADAERAAAVAAMAEANSRLQLLADVGRVLSGTHDISEQLDRLAGLVVPLLGDWCWIVATDDSGRLHEVATAHRDPARRAEVQAYVRLMAASVTEEGAPRVVFRTGRPLVIPDLRPERITASLGDPAAREALLGLAPAAVAVVPLSARGRTLGVLCLLNSGDRPPHTPEEVDTAVDIGRRAGAAIDQARLHAAQRELAGALQRSMLTAPPQPDSCRIAVRYVPAAAGAEIGGDWYDAFVEPGGATVLVIGDVVGHDSRAAAAMGQVRGLLRGISYSSGAPPAQVLAQLDRAVQGLALDTMATALVARLEQDVELPDGGTRLRWSSAGHPPPVLVGADGAVRVLGDDPPDLLLGVQPSAARYDRAAVLPPGSTLLLHTDGLVERRDRDLDAGTGELLAVLRENAGLPLEQLCDLVLERLFLPDAEDDVALLAVRLDPQGEPGA